MGLTKKAALAVAQSAIKLRDAEAALPTAGIDVDALLAEGGVADPAELEKRRDDNKLKRAVTNYVAALDAHEKAVRAAREKA